MKPYYVCHIFKKIFESEPNSCINKLCNKLQEYTPEEIKVLLDKHYKMIKKEVR